MTVPRPHHFAQYLNFYVMWGGCISLLHTTIYDTVCVLLFHRFADVNQIFPTTQKFERSPAYLNKYTRSHIFYPVCMVCCILIKGRLGQSEQRGLYTNANGYYLSAEEPVERPAMPVWYQSSLSIGKLRMEMKCLNFGIVKMDLEYCLQVDFGLLLVYRCIW